MRGLVAGRLEFRGSLEDQRHLLIRELLLGGHGRNVTRGPMAPLRQLFPPVGAAALW